MKTKQQVVIRGKGTKNEQRIVTGNVLYYNERAGMWMTIPQK